MLQIETASQQSSTVMEARQQEVNQRLDRDDKNIPIFLDTHTGFIFIESDIKTLEDTESEDHGKLKEALLNRDRPCIVSLPEGILGEGILHADDTPKKFRKKKTLTPIQKIAKALSISQEDLQDKLDIGLIMKKYPEHIGLIKGLVNKSSTVSEKMFLDAAKGTPRSERPTIIFGQANIDAICETTQNKVRRAFKYAIKEGKRQGKTKAEIIEEIELFAEGKGIQKSGSIENMAQFIGYVLRSFSESGGKPQVTDKELFDKIMGIFGPSANRLGGAAPQMSRLLDADGENVCLMTQCHSSKQSEAYGKDNNLPCIKLNGDSCVFGKVTEPKVIGENDPDRINIPVEHGDKVKITFNGKDYIAKSHDRVIVRSPGYLDKKGNVITPDLTFNCSDETLEELAKESPLFVINNLHNVQYYEQDKYEETMTTLIRQLGIIKRQGAKIMIEVSGNTSDMRFLSDLRGLIDFISLGGDELSNVNKSLSKIHPEIEMDTITFDEKNVNYFDVYQNGLSLLEVSNAEIINVHEKEMDLTVMNATSKEELNKKTMANFHAKLKVYGHLAGLTPQEIIDLVKEGNLSPLLRMSGKLEVLKFAVPYAKSLNLSSPEEEAKVIHEIMTTLSYYNPNGPSISLAPSKGLHGIESICTTGAGDRTGSVTANEFYKNQKDNDYYHYLWYRTKDLDLVA